MMVAKRSLSPRAAIVRYLKGDGKLGSVTFNNVPLADGQSHAVMFHLKGLRQGTSRLDFYVDCKLVETVGDVPTAFRGLPPGGNMVDLRTMPRKAYVSEECIHNLKLILWALSQTRTLLKQGHCVCTGT